MATPKNQRKTILNSPRLLEFKKQKQQESKKRIFWATFFLLAVSVGLIFISRWERVNISILEIAGNKVVDTEEINKVVEDNIAGYYIRIIPKTNFLFYPKNKIITDLSNNFERLEHVFVDIKGNTLLVSVTERKAVYTWCGKEKIATERTSESCYFLDDSGYVFDKAPYFSGAVYFRFYGKLSNEAENPLGSYYNKEIFSKLRLFAKNSEDMNLDPVGMEVDSSGEIKMYLQEVKIREQPEIFLRVSSDFEKITENLDTALSTDPLKTKFAEKYDSLEYIDLRFGNKVYFKFND